MKELTRKLAFEQLRKLREMAKNGEAKSDLVAAVARRTKGKRTAAWSFVDRALRDDPKTLHEPTLGGAILLEECAEEIKKGKRE
jgi:hypothetical protein